MHQTPSVGELALGALSTVESGLYDRQRKEERLSLRDPTPAYYRIFQTLRGRIASDVYPVDSQLPTEDALMEEFGVSRHTIRAAAQQLVTQGLVRRQAGKGTFVLRSLAHGQQWGSQSLEDMVDRSLGGQLEEPERQVLLEGSEAEVAMRLKLATSERLVRFSWRRAGPEGPYTYSVVHLAKSCADRLPEDWAERIRTTRLLYLVEDYCDVMAYRVRQLSSAVAADAAASARLQVPPGSPLLSLERTYFDRVGRIIEYSEILGRPDLCRQAVELFRIGR